MKKIILLCSILFVNCNRLGLEKSIDQNIYLDQAKIRDNRILYNDVTLVSYQQKDPVFQQQKKIFQIRQQKEKLVKELQLMKK